MEVHILANGDITITNGAWIILRWRKEKNRILRIAANDVLPAGWWLEAVALLEKTKKGQK